MLVADQTISGWSIWAALIILSREILVSGLREFLAEINAIDLRVSRLAKWKTVLQMIALGFLLAGHSGEALCGCPSINIGIVLLWIAAILTLYTGFDYLSTGLKRVSEDSENSE
jgi:phosphatidylglycerophosphate synthase